MKNTPGRRPRGVVEVGQQASPHNAPFLRTPPAAGQFQFTIERAITENAPPFDTPWPPTTFMDGWVVARELPAGKTQWRRILISGRRT